MRLTPKQELFANEIAEALDDMKFLKEHKKAVGRYSEEYLRENLEYVLERPREEITNSRAAYFIWLINHGGIQKRKRSRD